MDDAEYDRGSSASGSDESGDDQNGQFNIPSPVECSDEESAVSPSLYRKERMREREEEIEDRHSDEEEEDYEEEGQEEDDGDMEGDLQEEETVEYGPALSKNGVMDRLKMLASKFNDTLRELETTKQSRKSARSEFDFHPSPPRKRHAPFTPPKHGRLLVPATQYEDDEFDRDSLTSQSSRTTRKKLIGEWTVVLVKLKSECSRDEAIDAFKEYADDEIAKAGSCEDVIPRKDGLGYFKRTHVNIKLLVQYFDIAQH